MNPRLFLKSCQIITEFCYGIRRFSFVANMVGAIRVCELVRPNILIDQFWSNFFDLTDTPKRFYSIGPYEELWTLCWSFFGNSFYFKKSHSKVCFKSIITSATVPNYYNCNNNHHYYYYCDYYLLLAAEL